MPYSAAVDLVVGLGASQVMAHPSHRWTYREGTLVDEPSRTTSSSSSSYSLKEIIPEREPILVIDLSDDESVEGPEMAPVVAPGIGPGTSIEEDLSEPTSDSEMRPEPEQGTPAVTGSMGTSVANTMPATASPTPIPPVAYVSSFPPSLLRGGVREYDICGYCLWREQRAEAASQQVIALREEISRMDALFYAARQARRQETARAAIQFIAHFLGTTRDSVDRARDELESRPGGSGSQNMSGSQSPNRTDEVMSENSQNRQSEPTREATPRPEQATHNVIENFMIKMTELLETSMATRRNERVPVTGADEALERFLKFRPPEFYGDVEQEIKAELFLEQLNDIYDTLKYEDALRVTFAAFRLRGMAKDWLIDTDENKTRQFVKGLRVELQRALAPLPPMGFAAAVEAATRIEMADQAVIQRKTTIGSATAPYKRPGQGPWKPRDFKRSRGEQRTGNEGRPTLTPGGSHRICTYCGRSGHDQCPEMQQVTPEMSRKAGRPPVMRGTTEGRNNKPQVKAKVYALDGLPVDIEAEIVEGMIKIFSQLARVLIDPGATHFFVSLHFIKHIPIPPVNMHY
ncbi:hypothetical protein M9H77_09529 [Catharanthus roseus]|uniref:Uncharacterized protein n=1 Tax=Catharanthus roseus TaxID=4058 RepID=A0ACC0C128_CATRO|nr:hypothetical protein M9H77_09529 [Catharanthus roseus]